LSDTTYRSLMALRHAYAGSSQDVDFPIDLWARVVIEFAVVHNNGEGDPDKVVEALLPIFYGRAAAYVAQTRQLPYMAREQVVGEILQGFAASRQVFLDLWNHYQPS